MNYLVLPDSGIKLVDGSIVILARFEGTKWIVHNGWYTYNKEQYTGWYFSSIPSQTILPVTEYDLKTLTVVSNSKCDCPPSPSGPPSPPPPRPCSPIHNSEVPFTDTLYHQLDSAFLSVESIEARNQLIHYNLPNGKIVRVNNVCGHPQYYVWNATSLNFVELNLLTREEGDRRYAAFHEIDKAVKHAIKREDIQGKIDQAMRDSESLKEIVIDVSNDLVPDVVKDYTADLENRISSLEEHATWEPIS